MRLANPWTMLHPTARDFDLGGGFQHSGSYPMVFQHVAMADASSMIHRRDSTENDWLLKCCCRQPLTWSGRGTRQLCDVHIRASQICFVNFLVGKGPARPQPQPQTLPSKQTPYVWQEREVLYLCVRHCHAEGERGGCPVQTRGAG